MIVTHVLEPFPEDPRPVVLTIGNFDGVHLGHASILQHVATLAKKDDLPSIVLTFLNHPSTILRPNHPMFLLTTAPHKLQLLRSFGIDRVIMLPFTKEFSEQSAEQFLRDVHSKIPFRSLILGHDAKIGNDRQGNTPLLHRLAHELHFNLEFLPPVACAGEPISSSKIRKAISNEELDTAHKLLGRKYSVVGPVIHGEGNGHKLGYPTLNIDMQDIACPPFGVYIVTVKIGAHTYPGVANIGFAPTVRHDHIPLLEVHLLNHAENLYGQTVEVTFESFLRPERVFESLPLLQETIGQDVKAAKKYFHIP